MLFETILLVTTRSSWKCIPKGRPSFAWKLHFPGRTIKASLGRTQRPAVGGHFSSQLSLHTLIQYIIVVNHFKTSTVFDSDIRSSRLNICLAILLVRMEAGGLRGGGQQRLLLPAQMASFRMFGDKKEESQRLDVARERVDCVFVWSCCLFPVEKSALHVGTTKMGKEQCC